MTILYERTRTLVIRLTFAMSVMVLLVCAGCDRARPPSYDRLINRVVLSAFDAIEHDDHALAIDKLERLIELTPDAAIIDHLLREQHDSIIVNHTQAAITKHSLETARSELAIAIARYGTSRRLEELKQQVDALIRIEQYIQQQPFTDADDALAAVKALPSTLILGGDDSLYGTWKRDQQSQTASLVEAQRQRIIDELIAEYDLGTARQSLQKIAAQTQLGLVAATEPFYSQWLATLSGIADVDTLAPFGKTGPLGDVAAWEMLNRPPARSSTLTRWGQRRPTSITGLQLRAIASMHDGRYNDAVADLCRLYRVLGEFSPDQLGNVIDEHWWPRNTTATFTVQGILQQLIAVQPQNTSTTTKQRQSKTQ